jgi:cytochrome b subunit of formate dehydrogenase
MLAHLIAYVGALALLAIVGIHLWDQLPEKTKTYRIFRHPEGERELEAAAVISQQIRHSYAA